MSNGNKELMSIVNELYKAAGEEYFRDSFFSEILTSIQSVKWEKDIVLEFGPQIEETVQLLRDFSDRKYNRIGKDEVSILSALLLYFINLRNPEYANDYYRSLATQKLFASTLFKTASSTFRNYREYKLVNNIFLRQQAPTYNRQPDRQVRKPVTKPTLFEDKPTTDTDDSLDQNLDTWGFNELDLDGEI